MSEPIAVTGDTFEEEVLKSEVPVLGGFLGGVVWSLQAGRACDGSDRRRVRRRSQGDEGRR